MEIEITRDEFESFKHLEKSKAYRRSYGGIGNEPKKNKSSVISRGSTRIPAVVKSLLN